jgi:hypothetical protein
MRTRLIRLLVIVSLVSAALAAAQSGRSGATTNTDARAATIERLLEVSEMERLHGETLKAMIAAQVRADSTLALHEDLFRALIAKHLGDVAIKPEVIRIFAETFTDDQLEALTRFYASPIGKQVMATLPTVAVRSSEMAARRLELLMPELTTAIKHRAQRTAARRPVSSS